MGDNRRRAVAFEQIRNLGFPMPSLVHPRALTESDVTVARRHWSVWGP